MSHYQKPPELYDGLRLHQNENTGGCSPRVHRGAGAAAAGSDRLLPAVRRGDRRRARAISASTPIASRWSTASTKASWRVAVALPARRDRRRRVPEAIVPEPAFEIFRFDTAVAGGTLVQVMPRPDFCFPLDEVLAAITPNTRVVFLTNPNNPTGVDDAARRDSRRSRGACRRARSCSSTRRMRSSPASTLHPRARRASRTSIVGRTFSKAFGLAGLRIGASSARPTRSIRSAARSRSTASTSPPSSRSQAALDDLDVPERLPAAGRANRRRCSTPPAIGSACATGRATRTSCWSAPAIGRDALVKGAARARHLPPRPLDRAGLRRLPPHRHRHRRAHAARASR